MSGGAAWAWGAGTDPRQCSAVASVSGIRLAVASMRANASTSGVSVSSSSSIQRADKG